MRILTNDQEIGENVEISDDAEIICDSLKIGTGTVIKGNTRIMCKSCEIGSNNFINGVWIEGSLNAGKTLFKMGDENLILQNSRLNCNDNLQIGNDVNIGQNVEIWTHASSMNVLKGYPFTKLPVKIGSHVWITSGSTVLPGVNIGSNIIIGNNSTVNRNLPSCCFAAGSPVKIIKEKIYPKNLSLEKKKNILIDIINDYKSLLELKQFNANIRLNENLKIEFIHNKDKTFFDCINSKISGKQTKYSEDFRDFLRYRGVKFFTDKPFKSIRPNWFSKLIQDK